MRRWQYVCIKGWTIGIQKKYYTEIFLGKNRFSAAILRWPIFKFDIYTG